MKEFFEPKSIALIGASNKKGKIGNDIFNNLKKSRAKIIPVNVNGEKIGSQKAYKSVNDYSGSIDLAVIVIPAKFVPSALEDCGKKRILSAIIISAGFGEMGNAELENECVAICEKYKIKVLGPNCLGIINSSNDLNASFFSGEIMNGGISFISQSGAIGVAVLDKSVIESIGFCKFVSVGNMMNSCFSEWIDYLSQDKGTKVICLYIEGIKKGEEFVKAIKKCKKPIIALKAGFTESAIKAIASHTGSLAGNEKIYSSIFKQYGVIKAETLDEMLALAKHLSSNSLPKSKKVCVITNAGGLGVISSDACESNGLILADLPKKVLAQLSAVLPGHWSKGNPIDVLGDALAERYESCLKILSNNNFYDILLFILTPQSNTEVDKSIESLADFKKKNPLKSVFCCAVGGTKIVSALKIAEKKGIVNFNEPHDFAKAISKLF